MVSRGAAIGVIIVAAAVTGGAIYYLKKAHGQAPEKVSVTLNNTSFVHNSTVMDSFTTVSNLPAGVEPTSIYNMIAGPDGMFHQDTVHTWNVSSTGLVYDTGYGPCPFTPGNPYQLYSVVTFTDGAVVSSNVVTFAVT